MVALFIDKPKKVKSWVATCPFMVMSWFQTSLQNNYDQLFFLAPLLSAVLREIPYIILSFKFSKGLLSHAFFHYLDFSFQEVTSVQGYWLSNLTKRDSSANFVKLPEEILRDKFLRNTCEWLDYEGRFCIYH